MSHTTRVDNSANPNFRHLYQFHTREQWPQPSSSYTVFHGERPELPPYVPKYSITPATAALASRHGSGLYSFKATAERVGSASDGRATYRYSGSWGSGALDGSTGKLSSSTLGSSGLPPVAYKVSLRHWLLCLWPACLPPSHGPIPSATLSPLQQYLTEYVDEYREPVVSDTDVIPAPFCGCSLLYQLFCTNGTVLCMQCIGFGSCQATSAPSMVNNYAVTDAIIIALRPTLFTLLTTLFTSHRITLKERVSILLPHVV